MSYAKWKIVTLHTFESSLSTTLSDEGSMSLLPIVLGDACPVVENYDGEEISDEEFNPSAFDQNAWPKRNRRNTPTLKFGGHNEFQKHVVTTFKAVESLNCASFERHTIKESPLARTLVVLFMDRL